MDLAEPYYQFDTGSSLTGIVGAWRRIFSLPTYISHFESPTEEIIRTTNIGTREGITAFLLSVSRIAVQPTEEKTKIAAKIAEMLESAEGLIWLDKEKGEFVLPLATNVVIMERKRA